MCWIMIYYFTWDIFLWILQVMLKCLANDLDVDNNANHTLVRHWVNQVDFDSQRDWWVSWVNQKIESVSVESVGNSRATAGNQCITGIVEMWSKRIRNTNTSSQVSMDLWSESSVGSWWSEINLHPSVIILTDVATGSVAVLNADSGRCGNSSTA